MPKRNKLRNAVYIGNASLIVKNKEIRNKFTFCYMPDGSSYYWMNGMELSREELDRLYPIEARWHRPKGENKDGTKRYYE